MSSNNGKIIIIFISIFLSFKGYSQIITVVDSETNAPIENVTVYNLKQTQTSLSDKNGKIDIGLFKANEELYFQHASYEIVNFTKQEIIDFGLLLRLTKRYILLDEFVISANRWEQSTKEIPNKISVIKQQAIEFENPQTAADLLQSSNEIFVQKSQLGGGSPMIRGFATSSVLLVVDGVRMNNAIYRSGNLQNVISLDPNAIESSEIIFGPGSVTYGSDALGGVMDFHTKRIKLSTDSTAFIKFNGLSRFSSANNELMGHFDLNYGRRKWGFVTSLTYSDYDDLIMGTKSHENYQRPEYVVRENDKDTIVQSANKNIQRYTGYSQINLMQKFRYRPGEHLNLNYGFHYSSTSNNPRYDRLIQYSGDQLKYAEWYYGPQKWNMHNLSIEYSKSHAFADQIKSTIAFQDYQESRHKRKFESELRSDRTENLQAYSINIDLDKELKTNSHIYYGLEGVFNNLKSKAQEKNVISEELFPESTRYPDGKNHYLTLAAYTGYKKNFDRLTLISGLRYNYIYMQSTLLDQSFYNFPFNEINFSQGALNGSFGITYRPNNDWQFNANLSTGFHSPNIDDMAKIFDSEPGNVVVPNEDIEPEYAYNLDLGLIKKWKNNAKLKLSGFFTYLDNAMVRRDFSFNGQDSIMYDGEMSKVSAIVNANSVIIYGANLSFQTQVFSNFRFESFLNYTNGEDQNGMPLRHVAPLFGSTKISYQNKKVNISVYALYNGEISNNKLADSEKEKTYMYDTDSNGNPYSPGWATLNLKLAYNLSNVLTVNIGIENITDLRYRPYSSGIVAPGRNFIFTLRAKL